jgi:hypothetical protein
MINDFKGLSPARRSSVLVLILVGLGLVAVAERDIQRRPAAEMRGSKLLWRLACLNVLGVASYFVWGRRAASTAE